MRSHQDVSSPLVHGANVPVKDVEVPNPLPAEERARHAAMKPGGLLLA